MCMIAEPIKMSEMGQKRKCPGSRGTSVLPSGADIVSLPTACPFGAIERTRFRGRGWRRSPRLRLREFESHAAKRLLQHYRGNNGHRNTRGLRSLLTGAEVAGSPVGAEISVFAVTQVRLADRRDCKGRKADWRGPSRRRLRGRLGRDSVYAPDAVLLVQSRATA
jgi:hypothetical protein